MYGEWTGCGYPYRLTRFRGGSTFQPRTLYSWDSVPTNSTTSTFTYGQRTPPTCCSTLTTPTTNGTRTALGCTSDYSTVCPITGTHLSLSGRPHHTSTTSPTNIVGSLPTTTAETPTGCGRVYYSWLGTPTENRPHNWMGYLYNSYSSTRVRGYLSTSYQSFCAAPNFIHGNNQRYCYGCYAPSVSTQDQCPILGNYCEYEGRPYNHPVTTQHLTTGSQHCR